ncbi:MAG: hypothetical protein V4574_06395 [Pseudomonadota bacterium]
MIPGAMALLAALTGQADPDPLAPAARGEVQCTMPDKAAKTCFAITIYTRTAGGFDSVTTMMLSPDPLVTIEMAAPGTVEGNAICGVVTREQMAAAKVSVGGVALPPEQAAPILEQMMAVVAPTFGRKTCTRYRPEGDLLIAETEVEGVRDPQMTLPTMWVKPADGYRVGG